MLLVQCAGWRPFSPTDALTKNLIDLPSYHIIPITSCTVDVDGKKSVIWNYHYLNSFTELLVSASQSTLAYLVTVITIAGLLIASALVALYLNVPTWLAVKTTFPFASESTPANNAPETGRPVGPSVIVNTTV